jgi:serine/threonine protein phosphatase PrpC
MRFESRVFTLAKDPEHPEQNQDACCLDSTRGVAAIADGVASGIFSRQWAGILTEAVVSAPPDPQDNESFARWVTDRREDWNGQIDTSGLAWHQKPKLREGAFSTLLWIVLSPGDPSDPQESWQLRVFAVGDSCLVHVRDGQVLGTFPIERAEQLDVNPVVLGSVDLGRDDYVKFASLEESCRANDLLVLCTDAIAAWALAIIEAGGTPPWDDQWTMSRAEWQQEVTRLREEGRMRYDDATQMLLRVGDALEIMEPSDVSIDQTEVPPIPPDSQDVDGDIDDDQVALEPEEQQPPPLPSTDSTIEWREKLVSLSEQVADQVSDQVSRGLERLKKLKDSATTAVRKYREKHKGPDQEN